MMIQKKVKELLLSPKQWWRTWSSNRLGTVLKISVTCMVAWVILNVCIRNFVVLKVETRPNEVHPSNFETQQGSKTISERLPFSISSGADVHIAVVGCGSRQQEALTLLKSAILFTGRHLVFHIFTEKENHKHFEKELESWPLEYKKRMNYFFHDPSYPKETKTGEWSKLFRPCASLRLFFPSLLKTLDSVIYVDSDAVFLREPGYLWDQFQSFNSSHIAGLALNHVDPTKSWYGKIAEIPFYIPGGLNSGSMLMNLTRMRHSSWTQSVMEYRQKYEKKLRLGDQDIINIYFHYRPEEVSIFGCEWNYRSEFCDGDDPRICKKAITDGVAFLHGSRQIFHKAHAFAAASSVIKGFKVGDDIRKYLLEPLIRKYKTMHDNKCASRQISYIFTRQINWFVNRTTIIGTGNKKEE